MNWSTYLLCMLVTTAVFFGLTTPVLAGPTPTPATPTPATPTPATPTPPTAQPHGCLVNSPVVTVHTIAKGQNPSVNSEIRHEITGRIVGGAASYSFTAHRIRVCAGTFVSAVVIDSSGGDTPPTSSTGFFCNLGGCSGVVNVKEQYKSTSTISRDRDTITFIPE